MRLQTCISPAHLRCLRIWNNAGMVASKLDAHCTFQACPTLGSQHASDVPNTPYRQRIVACLLVVVLSMLVFQCDSSRHHQASVLFQRNSSTGLKRILCHLSRTRNTATSNRRATVFLTDVRYMITIRVRAVGLSSDPSMGNFVSAFPASERNVLLPTSSFPVA